MNKTAEQLRKGISLIYQGFHPDTKFPIMKSYRNYLWAKYRKELKKQRRKKDEIT